MSRDESKPLSGPLRTPRKLKKKALMTAMRYHGIVPTRSSSPGRSSAAFAVAPTMVHSSVSAFAPSTRTASLQRAPPQTRQSRPNMCTATRRREETAYTPLCRLGRIRSIASHAVTPATRRQMMAGCSTNNDSQRRAAALIGQAKYVGLRQQSCEDPQPSAQANAKQYFDVLEALCAHCRFAALIRQAIRQETAVSEAYRQPRATSRGTSRPEPLRHATSAREVPGKGHGHQGGDLKAEAATLDTQPDRCDRATHRHCCARTGKMLTLQHSASRLHRSAEMPFVASWRYSAKSPSYFGENPSGPAAAPMPVRDRSPRLQHQRARDNRRGNDG